MVRFKKERSDHLTFKTADNRRGHRRAIDTRLFIVPDFPTLVAGVKSPDLSLEKLPVSIGGYEPLIDYGKLGEAVLLTQARTAVPGASKGSTATKKRTTLGIR